MNRKEAYFEFSKIVSIDNDSKESYVHKSKYKDLIVKIYDSFEKDLKDINNQVSRLKKQLSKGHHIECSCSFCNPVDEKVLKEFTFTSCDDCKNKIDGTYQEICSNCKRFYGCYFEAKEV